MPQLFLQDYISMLYQRMSSRDSLIQKMRFFDFLFLREGKNIEDFFALLCNLPEWVKIAKKNSSQAYLITDQISIEILKTKLFPEQLKGEQKTYFDFLKETGINFMTIDELIKKLPDDNSSWKKLYDKINILIDKNILPLASLKDMCKILVNMGFKGDHAQTISIQKELDVIVDSRLAKKYTIYNPILKPSEILGFTKIFVSYKNHDIINGRNIFIQTNEASGIEVNLLENLISSIFKKQLKSPLILNSPEISVNRVRYIYTKKSLELANDIIEKISINSSNAQALSADDQLKSKEFDTRLLARAFENIFIITYYGELHNKIMNPVDLGIVGSIFLNSWTSAQGGKLHGQFITPIKDPNELDKILDESQAVPKLTCKRILSLLNSSANENIATINDSFKKISDQDLFELNLSGNQSKKTIATCLARPFGIDKFSYHPNDVTTIQDGNKQDLVSKFTIGSITATKILTLFLSNISNLITPSNNSQSQITSCIATTAKTSKTLAKPTSAPTIISPINYSKLIKIQKEI